MSDIQMISPASSIRTGAAFGLVLALLVSCVAVSAAAGRRPNVVFIIVDDSEAIEYGCYGGRSLTPNIDRIADTGVRFDYGFTSSSVCTPTRYTCLSGRYAGRAESLRTRYHQPVEMPSFVRWNTYLKPGGHNVASVLRQNGYTTAMIGKWHMGHSPDYHAKLEALPGSDWDTENSAVALGDPKADRSMKGGGPYALDDPVVNRFLRERYELAVEDIRSNFGFDHVGSFYSGNLTDYSKQMRNFCYHNQDWITQGALEFLDGQAKSGKPFYMCFSTTLQHGPTPDSSIRADRRITAKGLLDEVPKVQPDAYSIFKRLDEAGLPASKAPFVWFDDAVGAVMEKLREHGMVENTLVFFFSDQQSWGKGSCFDGGVRTPYMMSWPAGIEGGRVMDELVSNIDFVPTIFDACGVKAPAGMPLDGRSLLPLARGEAMSWREAVFFELGGMRAVRTRDFKYIAVRDYRDEEWAKLPAELQKSQEFRRRYFQLGAEWKKWDGSEHLRNSAVAQWRSDHARHASDPDQLYDLRIDPGECVNLFDNREYREQAAGMKQRLKEWLATMPGPFWEFKPVAPGRAPVSR